MGTRQGLLGGRGLATALYAADTCLPQPGHGLQVGIRQGFLGGVTVGITNCIFFCSWALALWFGSTRIVAGSYTGGGICLGACRCRCPACLHACPGTVAWAEWTLLHDTPTCVHTV